MDLSEKSLELFLAYAKDAENWGGNPWVTDGNVGLTKSDRGNLTDLKRKGFIETERYDGPGTDYIIFTEEGKALAAEHGITIREI